MQSCSFPYACTSTCSTTQWDEPQKRCRWKLEYILDGFDLTATPALLLAQGRARNLAGRGPDSSSQQQPFLRSAWSSHLNAIPVPHVDIQTRILLGLLTHTHSLNTKSSKTRNSWNHTFNAKTLGCLKSHCCQHRVPPTRLANITCIQWAKAILYSLSAVVQTCYTSNRKDCFSVADLLQLLTEQKSSKRSSDFTHVTTQLQAFNLYFNLVNWFIMSHPQAMCFGE